MSGGHKELLHHVIDIAVSAGQNIMAVYGCADMGTTGKSANSPLTPADLAAHRAIVSGLTELAPDRAGYDAAGFTAP